MDQQPSEYKLGTELFRNDHKVKWLVVRIVKEDEALVTNEQGQELVTKESYVMLKSELGEIDFILLLHEEHPISIEADRKIPSLPSLWRTHEQTT